jgi:HEPN domain-containing protein
MEEAKKEGGRDTYWLEIAEDDLEAAGVLCEGKQFVHMGFMCQQTIEKTLKACFVKRKASFAPFTHNLVVLARESGVYDILVEEQRKLLDLLQPLNIEARYPSYI